MGGEARRRPLFAGLVKGVLMPFVWSVRVFFKPFLVYEDSPDSPTSSHRGRSLSLPPSPSPSRRHSPQYRIGNASRRLMTVVTALPILLAAAHLPARSYEGRLDSGGGGGDCGVHDCLSECADGCLWGWVGDGVCDESCRQEDCQFDRNDCRDHGQFSSRRSSRVSALRASRRLQTSNQTISANFSNPPPAIPPLSLGASPPDDGMASDCPYFSIDFPEDAEAQRGIGRIDVYGTYNQIKAPSNLSDFEALLSEAGLSALAVGGRPLWMRIGGTVYRIPQSRYPMMTPQPNAPRTLAWCAREGKWVLALVGEGDSKRGEYGDGAGETLYVPNAIDCSPLRGKVLGGYGWGNGALASMEGGRGGRAVVSGHRDRRQPWFRLQDSRDFELVCKPSASCERSSLDPSIKLRGPPPEESGRLIDQIYTSVLYKPPREVAFTCKSANAELVGATQGLCLLRGRWVLNQPSPPTCKFAECEYGEWSEWSGCSLECVRGSRLGNQTRTRTVEGSPDEDGCSNTLEVRECLGVRKCRTECEYGAWGQWSECSATCRSDADMGTQRRSRSIEVYAEDTDGEPLPASECLDTTQPRTCPDLPNCPCELSDWGDWSECLSPWGDDCGPGKQKRSRTIERDGADCAHLSEERNCNLKTCAPRPRQLSLRDDCPQVSPKFLALRFEAPFNPTNKEEGGAWVTMCWFDLSSATPGEISQVMSGQGDSERPVVTFEDYFFYYVRNNNKSVEWRPASSSSDSTYSCNDGRDTWEIPMLRVDQEPIKDPINPNDSMFLVEIACDEEGNPIM
ncbi:unnamed protein product [Vitrella brassicaformis CCMP3155]|uniref:Spondin domain-containing protein n=3 Tax=Vitrella brassicaformis TaxID=1169539 RepID=A0A0G4EUP8_VITBC|nr:unnamed protein product [Vitrella brassicaformis CCMP3155]|eukprot:CEM02051.1 unnamed protein product [Vitrella brassicaformis CCMP3155]